MDFDIEQATFPIGRYELPTENSEDLRAGWIDQIAALPGWMDIVIENLDAEQLEVPYRPEGWNTRQVVHHLADSHINAYSRLRFALTEDNPTIRPYDEKSWALLADVEQEPINVSITLLHALHRRWVTLLKSLSEDDWQRTYYHPEDERTVPLWMMAHTYAWHGRHHMEQIRQLRERMGWR